MTRSRCLGWIECLLVGEIPPFARLPLGVGGFFFLSLAINSGREEMADVHSNCAPAVTAARAKYNDDRFFQLNGLMGSASQSAWTFLLTVNGGGAAGVLAFIGADEKVAAMSWPYVVLGIFSLALVFVGVAHAFIVHKLQALTVSWVATTGKYWSDQVAWSIVLETDEKLVRKGAATPWVLGWAAMVCFFVGLLISAYGFRSMVSG